MALSLLATTIAAGATGDSVKTSAPKSPPKDAADYILALPSLALRLPFKLMGAAVGQAVVVAEESPLPYQVQRLFAADLPWSIYPVVGYKSRTGLVGGVGYYTKSVGRSPIPLETRATYSTTTYRYLSLRLGDRGIIDSVYGIAVEVGWRADTRDDFYGVGAGSGTGDRTNYGSRGAFGSIAAYRQLGRGEIRVFSLFRRVEPEDGRLRSIPYDRDSIAALFRGQDLYGLFETLDLFELGTAFSYDGRVRPPSPLGGGAGEFRVAYTTGDGRGDTTVGFWRFHAEVSHFFGLFRERVIGLRLVAEHLEAKGDTRVPFYELPQLGGRRLLPGYRTGRFRDFGYITLAAEYKWPLWRHLDAILFTDHGRVFHDLIGDFEFSNFQSSYGGGLRIWNRAGHLGLAVAKGREDWRFYFTLGNEF